MQKKEEKKKRKTQLPFRLNILFFAVFLLFSVLIVRLGVVQIVYGETYKRELERTENIPVATPVPRGKIFDRDGTLIVDNMPVKAITYTRLQGTSSTERLEIAKTLATMIEQKTDKITERDMKDFWILNYPELAEDKVTEEEWKAFEAEELTDEDVYRIKLDRITTKDLSMLTDADLEILAIKRELDSAYTLTPKIVKNEAVSERETAIISENLAILPGVEPTTDWKRHNIFEPTLNSILGKVSSTDEGVPRDKLDYYISRDYSLNDRVGLSYIEKQYEDVLRGQKEKIKNITDKAGNLIEAITVAEGQRGMDLRLSIDMELQLAVEKIIADELMEGRKNEATEFLDRAYVVMMNPNTGEVLAIAGKRFDRDSETKEIVLEEGQPQLLDDALGTLTLAYPVGSAIKGATILTGYDTGVIQPGTILLDTPISIQGTPIKKSYRNMGRIDDLTALKRSSNVYMFRIAMGIGKANYRFGEPMPFDENAFSVMRNYFNQFGLGIKTGIDLPNEATGVVGRNITYPGLLLDFAIGQYDTYTPLQLVQYVSTIANGGYRIQPRIVKSIHEPVINENRLGPVVTEFQPNVLNKLDIETSYIERVKEGFRQVMQEPMGTATYYFSDAPYKPAGKTGTAQTTYDGPTASKYDELQKVLTTTLVGYAPYDNPEIAFSVVVPWSNDKYPISKNIGRKILDTYFNLKLGNQDAADSNIEQEQQEVNENQ
ncbi:penicillin-binding protein 2 [Bacillus sp. HMF5848]|uniref:peptidoglycan D,D-transpeptidase FtsI family protein n=1 Tax=Bacillus sp. HMF5848 TaxID=2495421 RepID=UPI000F78AE68|nr:penicillin-binding protein 2 [Bacillus sp. HMF5848]RSK27856.1 penicillin-binding protein 2 [Bacillus sp. HMF5848]